MISVVRFAIATPAAMAFSYNNTDLFLVLLFIQIVGDRLDGFLARRWRAQSTTGKILDTLADLAFFMGIFSVMLKTDHYYQLAAYFFPGIAVGALALNIRMVRLGRSFSFPVRPINHISFILYAAIVSMFYFPESRATDWLMLAGAALITLSALILFYRAVISKSYRNDPGLDRHAIMRIDD